MSEESPGRLVIISGPSGAGKSTIVRSLLRRCPLPLMLSVSATTRKPRPTEADGREYYFISDEEFLRLRTENAFLECKEVFSRGVWYGTLREEVERGLREGKWVILEIDVQGAMAILEQDLQPITIFIHPGGLEELERRLRARGTEPEVAIERRLQVARQEMEAANRYQHIVINRHVERAVDDICLLLQEYRSPKVLGSVDDRSSDPFSAPCTSTDPRREDDANPKTQSPLASEAIDRLSFAVGNPALG